MFESLTVFHRDILSLHLFLNTEALTLGEEPRIMTLSKPHFWRDSEALFINVLSFINSTSEKASTV